MHDICWCVEAFPDIQVGSTAQQSKSKYVQCMYTAHLPSLLAALLGPRGRGIGPVGLSAPESLDVAVDGVAGDLP